MIGVNGAFILGDVKAIATEGQRSPAEWARIAASKMVQIAGTAPQPIRDQAHAFRSRLERIIANYIEMAIREDRAILADKLEREGHASLASFLRSR